MAREAAEHGREEQLDALLTEYLQRKGNVTQVIPPVSVDTRVWYNPSLEGKNFTIPASWSL